jgi:hypothetical protein
MATVHSPAGRFVALSDMGILVDDRVAPEAAAEEVEPHLSLRYSAPFKARGAKAGWRRNRCSAYSFGEDVIQGKLGSSMPTLANALLEGLKDHGAGEIFGIPGYFVLPFFKTIEESSILPHFTLSHEPAVGFAADASARYHGGHRRSGGYLRSRGLQSGELGCRRLCGTLAGCGDCGRSRRSRTHRRIPPASPGAHRRHPACGVQGNHLRSGSAHERGERGWRTNGSDPSIGTAP